MAKSGGIITRDTIPRKHGATKSTVGKDICHGEMNAPTTLTATRCRDRGYEPL